MRRVEQEDTEDSQAKVEALKDAVNALENNPKGVKFADLSKLLEGWFGEPRKRGSHRIYKTPWRGDPRLNIQSAKGMAKPYQVRQATRALRKRANEEKGSD